MLKNICKLCLSVGGPTYWTIDPTKIPGLIDFAIYIGMNPNHLESSNNEDMSSDHSALIININMPVFFTSRKQHILSKRSVQNKRRPRRV